MAWDTGTIINADPTGTLSDKIQALFGTEPCRNWSLVETVSAGLGTAEVQRLTLSNFSTGDTFRLTFNGHETADIAYTSTGTALATSIRNALNAIADFSGTYNNVTCAYISGQGSATVILDISHTNVTRWWGVAFSVVGSFSVTNAVGCTGSLTQTVAPVIASGHATYAIDVFKCSGSGNDANDCGNDFYLYITRSTTGVTLSITVSEEYDPIYHKARKPIPAGLTASTNGISTGADGYPSTAPAPTTYILPGFLLDNTYASTLYALLNITGFTYAIKLTKNFLLIGVRVATTETYGIFGLMDSLIDPAAATDSLPLCMYASNAYASGGIDSFVGGFHKLPGVANQSGVGTLSTFRCSISTWPIRLGTNIPNDNDKWANNKAWVSRASVYHYITFATKAYAWGWLRGLLKSDIRGMMYGGTMQLLDTVDVDGVTYTVFCGTQTTQNFVLLVTAD